MPEPEATLVIKRSDNAGSHRDPMAETEAKRLNRELEKQVQAKRRKIHEQADIDALGVGAAPQAEPVPAPVREDIESIEITLPDGRVVEYGPPTGVSLSDRIARLFSTRSIAEGGPDPGVTEYRLTRVLMGVRNIGGKPVAPINDLIMRTKLANQLGDDALDLLFYFDRLHWPPLTSAELPIVRKKFRNQPSGS